jgi:tRNA threonylcarbamoyladenosine biosynthesis protein TsaE
MGNIGRAETVYHSQSVDETRSIGALFAATAKPGDVLALCGDLGCGKTEFVRGFTAALCEAPVSSPTFSLVNRYGAPKFTIIHIDFYRLGSPRELPGIGFDDLCDGINVCLIEWADMFAGHLPGHTQFLRFTDTGEQSRSIEVVAPGSIATP